MATAKDVTKRGWRYFWAKLFNLQDKYEDPTIRVAQAVEEEKARLRGVADSAAKIVAQSTGAQRRMAELNQEIIDVDKRIEAGKNLYEKYNNAGDIAKAGPLRDSLITLGASRSDLLAQIAGQQTVLDDANAAAETAKKLNQKFEQDFQKMLQKSKVALGQVEQTKMMKALSEANDSLDSATSGTSSLGNVTAQIQRDADEAAARVQISGSLKGRVAEFELDQAVRDAEADEFLGLAPLNVAPSASLEQGSKS